jgi:uncharacterized membrane protein YozB (DUF420 family)
MALALTAFVFAGFAPTYFMLSYFHGATLSGLPEGATLTPLVHMHAFVTSAWMVLLVAQTGLISARRYDLHRTLGLAALGLIPLMLIVGMATALTAARLAHVPPGWTPPAFLLIPLSTVIGFALFAALALAFRRDAQMHKRLMLLATISLVIPAGARLASHLQSIGIPAGPAGGMLLVNLFLVALVAFDLFTRSRLHPATLWGGGAFLLSEPLRVAISHTDAWQGFARTLIA